MKQIMFIVAFVATSLCANAQYVLKGNTFSHVTKKDTLVTQFDYETSTGKWKIIMNKKTGSCYYYCKTKEGKIRKYYCPNEVSAQVAKNYGIEYKPRTSK